MRVKRQANVHNTTNRLLFVFESLEHPRQADLGYLIDAAAIEGFVQSISMHPCPLGKLG